MRVVRVKRVRSVPPLIDMSKTFLPKLLRKGV
jgi:hypothetical protein